MQSNISKCGNHVITHKRLKGLLLPENDVQVLLLPHLLVSEGQYKVAMVTGRAVEVQMFLRPADKRRQFNWEQIHCQHKEHCVKLHQLLIISTQKKKKLSVSDPFKIILHKYLPKAPV